MAKVDRPQGLIRYTSQDELAGKKRRVLRARTIIYPALLMVAGSLLFLTIERKPATEISIGRAQGASFVALPDGGISAQVRLKIVNTSDAARRYFLALADAPDATLRSEARYELAPHKKLDVSVFIDVPAASFVHGQRRIYLKIHDSSGSERIMPVTLLGPEGVSR
jgi:polyferredoxin